MAPGASVNKFVNCLARSVNSFRCSSVRFGPVLTSSIDSLATYPPSSKKSTFSPSASSALTPQSTASSIHVAPTPPATAPSAVVSSLSKYFFKKVSVVNFLFAFYFHFVVIETY